MEPIHNKCVSHVLSVGWNLGGGLPCKRTKFTQKPTFTGYTLGLGTLVGHLIKTFGREQDRITFPAEGIESKTVIDNFYMANENLKASE